MKRVRMWIREDGEPPKAVPRDTTTPPGPGRLVDVEARDMDDARRQLDRAQRPEPDRRQDRAGWLAWDEARDRVTDVPAENPAHPAAHGPTAEERRRFQARVERALGQATLEQLRAELARRGEE